MTKHVIYKIINTINNKFYVGSTSNTKVRFREHRRKLRSGKHHCKHLQAAWNKYGEHTFVFVVVEEVTAQDGLFAAEDKWLKEHHGTELCYNAGKTAAAPWRGVEKHKQPSFGRPKTENARVQISATLKAFYAEAPENHPRYGKQHTEETKAKISASRKGKKAGAEHYRYDKELSEEVKQKIGDAQRGVKKPAGRKVSPEGIEKIKAAVKRGAESHFYGKSPANIEELKKAVYCSGNGTTYASITEAREALGISPGVINHALKTGKPIKCGQFKGWQFSYV